MNEFQSGGRVMGGWRLRRLAGLTPAAAVIPGLVLRVGGSKNSSSDRIDLHLRRLRGRAESGALLRLHDFASGR